MVKQILQVPYEKRIEIMEKKCPKSEVKICTNYTNEECIDCWERAIEREDKY